MAILDLKFADMSDKKTGFVSEVFTITSGSNVKTVDFKADVLLIKISSSTFVLFDRRVNSTKAYIYNNSNTPTSTPLTVTDNESSFGSTNRVLVSDNKIGFYETASGVSNAGCIMMAY